MNVGRKTFVLMGLTFGLAPLTLDAAPPTSNRARSFSAVHTSRSKVKSLRVACRLDTKATGGLAVHLDVHNPTRKTVTAELKVDVFARRPSSPMARMIPPPVHHGSRILKVTLKPGARMAKSLLIKKGKAPSSADVPRYYTLVRKAPRKRANQPARRHPQGIAQR
jgi:hypothetical protein